MLAPGLKYVNQELRFTSNFADSDGVAVDPDTVVFKALSPWGAMTTLTYGTDAALQRLTTGSYVADLAPNEAGRWWVRWESTGTGKATVSEESFNIQKSAFFDPIYWAYRL